MSQADGMSTGGESARGPPGHTGTGCYKNHEHSMHAGASAASMSTGGLAVRGAQGRRQSCGGAPGVVSIAAVTALLASSPATTGIIAQHQPPHQVRQGHQGSSAANNLVDLGIYTSFSIFFKISET